MKNDFHRLVRVKKGAKIYKRYETKRVIQIKKKVRDHLEIDENVLILVEICS